MINKILKNGFVPIFISNISNNIILFLVSIILIRTLTPEEFGKYSYAENIISLLLLLNMAGTDAGLLQFSSEEKSLEKKNAWFSYSLQKGLSFSLLISILIFILADYLPLEIEGVQEIIKSMSLMPLLLGCFQLCLMYERSTLNNKKFAYLNTGNAFLILIFVAIGSLLFGISGAVYGKYFAFGVTIIFALNSYKNIILRSPKLSRKNIKDFWRFSILATVNNSIAKFLYLIDIFFIGIILANDYDISIYKTAILIPFALNFIPTSIVMYVYPYFTKRRNDSTWLTKNINRLIRLLFLLNLIIVSVLIAIGPLLIPFLFGEQYKESYIPFCILMIGYLIAGSFRIPLGNILLMMRKIKFNFYVSIISGVINIVINWYLIKSLGINGAAISTLTIFIFTSIVNYWYILRTLKIMRRL